MTLTMDLQNVQQKMVCYGVYYGERIETGTSIKFEMENIESSLCDYSDAYIFVTGDITATGGNANTNIAFKHFAPFTRCVTHWYCWKSWHYNAYIQFDWI